MPTEGESAAVPIAASAAPLTPKDAAAGGLTNGSISSNDSGAPESTVASNKKAGTKGGVSEGFMAMLSFREESLGDQIKFALCLVLAIAAITAGEGATTATDGSVHNAMLLPPTASPYFHPLASSESMPASDGEKKQP